MDYLEGMKWAIPKAFIQSIAKCRFVHGDVLYSSKVGYEPWDKAQKGLKHSIQITSNLNNTFSFEESGDSNESILEDNWTSPLEIELVDYVSRSSIKKRVTQGQLLYCIWHGDLSALDEGLKALPLTLKWLRKKILESEDSIMFNIDREPLFQNMKNRNIFLYPYCLSNDYQIQRIQRMEAKLNKEFKHHKEKDVMPFELLSNGRDYIPTNRLRIFAVDTPKIEALRDVFKEILWSGSSRAKEREKPQSRTTFKLSRHGLFKPYRKRKILDIETQIQQIPLRHKNLTYYYRVHLSSVKKAKTALTEYFDQMFIDCPNHIFNGKSLKCSKLKRNQFNEKLLTFKYVKNNSLLKIARSLIGNGSGKNLHNKIEKHLLINDDCTIACEVPVWCQPSEMPVWENLFLGETMTGHIDIVRVLDGSRIQVCDYKSNIERSPNCYIQIFFYAQMLSYRTGIPLTEFECCVFDKYEAVTFTPSEYIATNKAA